MSVKALEDEFQKVYEQYHEMRQDIVDIEKEVEQGLVEPEFIEKLKQQIAPIKDNFEYWSYIMFLLHQPQRKEKQKAYQRRNKKLLDSIQDKNTPNFKLQEGQKALTGLKEFTNGRTSE